MNKKFFNCSSAKERKAKIIIDYFTSKTRIDVTDKNYESAIKLDKMIGIYNTDTDALCKFTQMKDIFSSSDAFAREYSFLEEFIDADTIYELYFYIQDITKFLKKYETGLSKEREKELISLEKGDYFRIYPFAKYFVNEYLEYNKSPYIRDFLEEKGLYQLDFDRFLTVLFKFDDVLYDQYLRKAADNRLSRQLDVIRKLENLRSGTTTGKTTDGTPFDEIEFYCNLPFYDLDSSSEIFEDFGIRKTPTVDRRIRELCDNLCFNNTNDIMKYMFDHKLVYKNPSPISEREIKKSRYRINDKELTDEGKTAIIEYMKARKIPFIVPAYNTVRGRYFENPESLKVKNEAVAKELKINGTKPVKKEDNE